MGKISPIALALAGTIVLSTVTACAERPTGSPPPVPRDTEIAETVDAAALERLQDELRRVGPEQFTASEYRQGDIKHIVLFRFKPETPSELQRDVERRFRALATEATRNGKPYIASIESGPQISGERAGKNLQVGFVVTFASEGDRNYYVGSPIVTSSKYLDEAHQAFKDYVGPHLEDVVVFDIHTD